VQHMLAAGWGGVGSVSAPKFAASMSDSGIRWRTRSSSSVSLAASARADDFEIPAFLRYAIDDDSLSNGKRASKRKARRLPQGPVATPLVILRTFECAVQKVMGSRRFVAALQDLKLSAQMEAMLDELTTKLGTDAKAWALVVQWLAERLAGQFTLSRQGERVIRQLLHGQDLKAMQDFKRIWAKTVDEFLTLRFCPTSQVEDEDMEIPAFLRKQED